MSKSPVIINKLLKFALKHGDGKIGSCQLNPNDIKQLKECPDDICIQKIINKLFDFYVSNNNTICINELIALDDSIKNKYFIYALKQKNIPLINQLINSDSIYKCFRKDFLTSIKECSSNSFKCIQEVIDNMFKLYLTNKNFECLNLIIDIGISNNIANIQDENKDTLLMYAADNNQLNAVKALAQNTAVNLQNQYGYTALMYAAENGFIDIVKYLINESNTDINITSVDENTALIFAADHGHLDIVKLLVEKIRIDKNKNIDAINVQNNEGFTALMYAAYQDNFDIVKILINNGAKINITNKIGKTALTLTNSKEIRDYMINNSWY